MEQLDAFITAYAVAALWSTNDESNPQGGDPLDDNYNIVDIADATLQQMIDDCKKFREENKDLLELSGLSDEYAGHDFWLTRCGHGAGFWDRGSEDVFDQLTEACKKWGEIDLYVGDDGKIYH
jgi:hypothetical protein